MKRSHLSGQIGLMLLVVMGVVVSLVLSVAARSFTDVTLSRREKESNAAFSIAETGVEEALLALGQGNTGASGSFSDVTNTIVGNYDVNVTSSYDLYLNEGESAQIDLSGTPSNIALHWVKPGEKPGTCAEGSGSAPAAVEVSLIDGSNKVTRWYYNAYGCDLSSSNKFANSFVGTLGDFTSKILVTLSGGEKYLRVKPIYNGATINVTGTGLTSQLYVIQAKAQGQEARTDIEVKRSLEAPGSVFDYALFSGTTIIK